MADAKRRRPENATGPFFVDTTCIDCDTCRWMAPAVFGRAGEQSIVAVQPTSAGERRDALRALLACPTASIGCEDASRDELLRATSDFPLAIDDTVYHCGFHHARSFGAASYLIRRERGNVLVDCPRFVRPLVERIEALGGVRTLFLTHRDDVADHDKWAKHFGCERVMHERDSDALPIERRIVGEDAVELDSDLLAIPTPGHTEGSMCLLHAERHLFTGDHLAWSVRLGHVYAFRSACWYDWATLIESTRGLLHRSFEWILPGHGRRCHFERDVMREQLECAISWMEANPIEDE